MKTLTDPSVLRSALVMGLLVTLGSPTSAQITRPGAGPGRREFPASVSAKVSPESAKPGETVTVAVTVTLDLGYHTYDLVQPDVPAVASQISLEAAEGLEPVGEWIGPAAEAEFDKVQNKHIFVHHASPTWSHQMQVAAGAAPGERAIAGKLRFVVCNEMGCLPPQNEKFTVSLNVESGEGTDSAVAPPAAEVRSPPVAPDPAASEPTSAPKNPGMVSAEATISEAATLLGELLTNNGLSKLKIVHVDKQVHSIWGALLFGFLAGLILNVMPCVLPVISLKIYGFVKQAGEDRLRVRLLGLSFGAGILLVFAILAGLAAFAGLAWGQLFQRREFVVGMVGLMVACALGMFDVYVIRLPGFVSDADAAAAQKEGLLGSFFKGMLATVLATPCSGPFLGATIAYALSQPVPVIFTIYLAMGIGMASPYVVLAMFPAWMKKLPRPGEWMNTFKQFMGFLLLGTAIWLLWQRRDDGELVVWTVAFGVFVALAVWLYGHWSDPLASPLKRFAAPVLALLLVLFGAYFCFAVMYEPPNTTAKTTSDHWPPFDLDKLLAARDAGRTVVVDWTADW